jgi:catechol 2,3-dioxygenase-like lactoylglutathione lyase family enzyme
MIRYTHTNIIAKDKDKLIAFYKDVFGCQSIGQTRDLRGEWVDRFTGLKDAHITGEHLALPGYGEAGPTLEIFSYDGMVPHTGSVINRCGFTHIAFSVDDVGKTLKALLAAGGGQLGELVTSLYPDGRKLELVYATDIEGNIVEIQKWS